MPDTLDKLNDLFLTYKSSIDPGTDLHWHTFEIDVEAAAAKLGLIKEQIGQVNKGGSSSDNCGTNLGAFLFCNPILIIFEKIEFVVDYFCGEFEIQTKNKKLREELAGIWRELIKGWYFGEVYVAYGEVFEEMDRQKFALEGKDFDLDGIPGKFRLYKKSGKTFTSVLSGQSGIKFNASQKKKIVRVSENGKWNWFYWFNLWYRWFQGMQRFEDSVKCLSKNIVLTPRSQAEVDTVKKQFENNECFLVREGGMNFGTDATPSTSKTKFDELIFTPRETPMAILECVQRSFELHAAHKGFAGKLEVQKKERVNAGENFPHQKVVSNVVTTLISSLNYAFDQMRIKFGEDVIPSDLKIVRTNQAFAQGLPEYQPGGNFNKPFNSFGDNNNWKYKHSFEDNQGND